MSIIRYGILIGFGVQLLISGNLLAEDKLVRANGTVSGKITKVDDNQVYLQLGDAGGTAFKRSDIKQVEIDKPASYEQGLKALKEGKIDAAIEAFEPIHSKYYGLPQPWLEDVSIKLGDCFLRKKNWAKARDVFQKFQKFYPQSSFKDAATYGDAHSSLGLNEKARAIELLEGMLAAHKDDISVSAEQSEGLGRACVVLGQSYAQSGKAKEALETFLKVPVLYYADGNAVAEAEYEAALIYEKQNNKKSARIQLETIINEFPDSPFAAEAKKKIDSLKS